MIVHSGHAARRQRRIIRAFRAAAALAPEHAKTLQQLGLTESRDVRGLLDRRIIREVMAGCFYLDEDAAREDGWLRLRVMAVPAALFIALLVWAIASRRH